MNQVGKIFLTAEWRRLVMLNYEIEPATLRPLVPAGTELDTWNGKTLVSIVGFLFLRTRLRGIAIPLHQNFEEVNLRFYVRRKAEEGWRRGVVFIKEIVPRRCIAWIARAIYNEPYMRLPMGHWCVEESGTLKSVEYHWLFHVDRNTIRASVNGPPGLLVSGSEAEFITEHYWGYNTQRDGSTFEYRVDHPRWQVYENVQAQTEGNVAGFYGEPFARELNQKPHSAFVAEGSVVTVYQGTPISA